MKKNLVLGGVLLILVMMIGCAPIHLIVGGGAAATYKTAVDERSAGSLWGDAATSFRVKSKMIKDSEVHAWNVDVDTLESEVILTGVVGTKQQATQAGEVARKVPGVRKVRNELQVGKKSIGQSLDDTLLSMRVKTHLFKEPWIRSFNIDVDVDNGVVALTGIVDRTDHKARVLEIARSIPETVRVIDNLKVKP